MKLAVLFSGGKDSAFALARAMQKEEVVCLISITSKNKESYMFHTPNIEITKLQAEAIGLPLIEKITEGEKENELNELWQAMLEAKEKYGAEGIVTGAIESVYQAERVQRLCDELDLWCFNPLWKKDQELLLKELLEHKFRIIISGVFAFPLDKSWLGRIIDDKAIEELLKVRDGFMISPSGEGGEIETTVLDAPFFKNQIEIVKGEAIFERRSGVYEIKEARLVQK